jgi:hypothetical protein
MGFLQPCMPEIAHRCRPSLKNLTELGLHFQPKGLEQSPKSVKFPSSFLHLNQFNCFATPQPLLLGFQFQGTLPPRASSEFRSNARQLSMTSPPEYENLAGVRCSLLFAHPINEVSVAFSLLPSEGFLWPRHFYPCRLTVQILLLQVCRLRFLPKEHPSCQILLGSPYPVDPASARGMFN